MFNKIIRVFDPVSSGIFWHSPQQKYSTIKKEILAIVLCVSKFQDDLFIKKFLLRINCKSAKEILQKDVQNLVSKQIFARWQAILSAFDFDIEFIKGSNNSLPVFLTRVKERVAQIFLCRTQNEFQQTSRKERQRQGHTKS